MNDYTDNVIKGSTTQIDKAKKIYAFVRDNYTCTNHNSFIMAQNLRNVAKGRNGNVAEINLLLTAFLRHENISADPVILSTRSHGYTYELYPLPDKFNYLICKANIDGKDYFLDASHPQLGFAKLDYECYNGHARVIDPMATAISLQSDSLLENSITSVFMTADAKGGFEGNVQHTAGYYESNTLRRRIKESGRDNLFSEVKKAFAGDVEINEGQIDSLSLYEEPVTVRYRVKINGDNEDIIYFNPMMGEAMKDNPFKAAERFYPVEMPYTIDEMYLLRLSVPDGYKVDELPKQMMVKLNEDNEGLFEYRISESAGVVSMRSRIFIKRTYFQPDEYEMLREFFNLVVKKHAEQIVFKKK